MTTGAETVLAEEWITDQLAAASAVTSICPSTRHYIEQAPSTPVTYPLIVIQNQDASDLKGVGGIRIWTNALYVVKAGAQTSDYSVLQTLAEAIDDALETVTGGAVTGGNVWACTRTRPFRLPEVVNGQPFRWLGGIYEMYAQGS